MKVPFHMNLISKQFFSFKQLKLSIGSFRDFFATYVNQAGFKKLRERLCADSYSQSMWNGKCHTYFWIKTFPCQMFAKFPKFTISGNDQIIFCCLLQDNVSCGRSQNDQVYKHGFHDETLHCS